METKQVKEFSPFLTIRIKNFFLNRIKNCITKINRIDVHYFISFKNKKTLRWKQNSLESNKFNFKPKTICSDNQSYSTSDSVCANVKTNCLCKGYTIVKGMWLVITAIKNTDLQSNERRNEILCLYIHSI